MARARNIKPGFFKNEILPDISFQGRLLFIGLWTLADRAGRLEYRPRRIKGELFPYEDCDVESQLAQLEACGFIRVYEAGGRKLIQILNFDKHQSPHHKEPASTLPAPDEPGASTGQVPDKHETSQEKASASRSDSGYLIAETLGADGPPPAGDADANASAPPPAEEKAKSKSGSAGDEDDTPTRTPYAALVDLYHDLCPRNPRVQILNDTRKSYLRARWRDMPTLEEWQAFFGIVAESKFLTGQTQGTNGRPPFRADFYWLIKPTNFVRIIEGKYSEQVRH